MRRAKVASISAFKPDRSAQILSLENQAREAYARGNYAEPQSTSAIAYSKRVLSMDPTNDYSKKLLENAVIGGRYQVQQAITRKDFAAAHRVANAMAQLLPTRQDVAGLKGAIAVAEHPTGVATRTASNTAQAVRFRVYHLHGDKPPDKGPYCHGILSATGTHLKFTADSASDGSSLHNLAFDCSEIREIKKNGRVAAHQGGFHVRADSGNFNFVPEDPSGIVVSTFASICSE